MADQPTPTPTPAPTSSSAPPASGGGASAPSSPSPSPHLAALTSDTPSPSAERPPEPAPTPEPAPEPEPAPSAPSYKYRGKDYTLAELEPLIGNILTTAEQFPHLQGKYQDMLERLAAAAQQPPPQQSPQQTPQQFQAGLRDAFAPRIRKSIEHGWIEADFAELYPNVTAQAHYLTASLEDVVGRLIQLEGHVGGMGRRSASQEANTNITAALDQIATRGPLYAALSEPGKRQEYLDWLAKSVNPIVDVGNLDSMTDVLGRLWLAFNSPAIAAAAKATNERETRQREDERRRAAGAGSGTRPMAPATTAPTHLDTLLEGTAAARR